MVCNLSEKKSIANRFIAEMRSREIQPDSMRFRRNMERLGEVMAYEISQTLEYVEERIETPFGIASVNLPREQIVLATILRAGLPFHQGFLNYFDDAGNAFVSAYRKHHKDGSFEIALGYVSCPDLTDCILIVIDPMLATGASMDVTVEELKKHGEPKKIHIVTAVASRQGLDYVKRKHSKADIWVGAIDEELTAKSYIVPGLGDAGDLAFGAKVQE